MRVRLAGHLGRARGTDGKPAVAMATEHREREIRSVTSAQAEAILVPVLNEAGAIAAFLDELAPHAGGRPLYLLDSNSSDATVREARRAAKRHGLKLAVVPCPPGLAASIRCGIEHSPEERIAVISGDGQHAPSVLNGLFARLAEGWDVAVGSRRVKGAAVAVAWPWRRRVASKALLWTARHVVRCHGAKDPLSGCFALRREAWERRRRFDTGGYKFLLDFLAASRGLRVTEAPVRIRPNDAAASKVSFAVFWELLVSIVRGAVHCRVPRRWISFGGVGALGTGTDAGVTAVLHGVLDAPFAWARTASILSGMTQNYLLNNALTFRDKRRRGGVRMASGWALYAASQSIGAGTNWGVSVALHGVGVPWPAALLSGVMAGVVINFVTARQFVWKGKASQEAG